MNILTKDIIRTLSIKLVFLIFIWFVCCKCVQRNPIDLAKWLYGVQQASTGSHQTSLK